MKKIYFAPQMTIVKVELQRMIAASPDNQELNPVETPVEDEEEVGSRFGNFSWDEY